MGGRPMSPRVERAAATRDRAAGRGALACPTQASGFAPGCAPGPAPGSGPGSAPGPEYGSAPGPAHSPGYSPRMSPGPARDTSTRMVHDMTADTSARLGGRMAARAVPGTGVAVAWLILGLWTVCMSVGLGCAVPRRLWPQSDIEGYYLGNPTASRWVLVAARHSDFKNAVLAYLDLALREERERSGDLYVRFVGIEQLENEPGSEYDAVVIINTCIAAGLDRRVDSFLRDQPTYDDIMVVTTSGDGDWMPCPVDYQVEAITSVSKRSRVQPLVAEILDWLRPRLNASGLDPSSRP